MNHVRHLLVGGRGQRVGKGWVRERPLETYDRFVRITPANAELLGPLLRSSAPRANLVPDAHLAALAIEHGLVVCSTDGDFARFAGVRWQNPLA